jgi:hypothetical protein
MRENATSPLLQRARLKSHDERMEMKTRSSTQKILATAGRLSVLTLVLTFLPQGFAAWAQAQREADSKSKSSDNGNGGAAGAPTLPASSPVRGSGTPGFIPIWITSGTIANSTISESSGLVTLTGGLSTSGDTSVGGNLAVTGSFIGTTASFVGSSPLPGVLASFTNNADGGNSVKGTGGNSPDGAGGAGLIGFGGNSSSNFSQGGDGVVGLGGNNLAAKGGAGVNGLGGLAASGDGGPGVLAQGGPSDTNFGGDGIDAYPGAGANSGLAGFFSGNIQVTGTIFAGVKDFMIDHPLDPANKYLYHTSVESSEMLNLYAGNAILGAGGEIAVQLPEWFDAENTDFRYQLTAIGVPAPGLYIAREIHDHQFVIAGGQPGMKVSWQVTAVRQDAYAKAHPVEVEVMKPERERGRYIHPELYGQPKELQIERGRATAR